MTSSVVSTICPFCGVGCGLDLKVQDNQVIAVEPIFHHPVSLGQLCVKGWNAAFGIDPGNRITTPLLRKIDTFHPISWDEALNHIANQFTDIISNDGPDALGVISCARATNEDNYAAQKFARCVLGTNNIDHCARICHSPTVAGLKQTLGSGAMTNSISDIDSADLLVVFGADPTENHTVLGGRIIKAKTNGAKLLVVDPRKTRLAELADVHLQLNAGTNIALINGLLNIIFSNNWEDTDFLASRCENQKEFVESLADYPATKVAEITGVAEELLDRAAYLYSHAQRAFLAYGMGITQFVSGTNNVIGISNLALSCGQIGRVGTGINPLRGQNNVQGACDMGCLPNVFPGYQPVSEPAVQEKFSSAWDCTVPTQPGLTSLGMAKTALGGKFKGLIVMGEDPVVTDPDQQLVQRAFRSLDLLVVCELTMTETAKMADIVLPVVSFAEKTGTFTNCERRVQLIQKAIPSFAESKSDWRILSELATRMGYKGMGWQGEEAIFDEMVRLTPLFSEMSYPKLIEYQGLQWPCDESHPDGTMLLHSTSFSTANGKGKLIPVRYVPPDEQPDDEYPLVLTTNRLHFHYGCGSMTRKSPLLERETPDGVLFINANDGESYNINNHEDVLVSSRRGEVSTRAVYSEQVPQGLVSMPYHFKEAPSNRLTNNAQDPVTKMPELKVCAVKIKPIKAGALPISEERL